MTDSQAINRSTVLCWLGLFLAGLAGYWHTMENQKTAVQTIQEQASTIIGGDPEYYAMNNENADHPVINTDSKGVVVSANRAAVEILGVEEGSSLLDVMEADNAEKHKEIMAGDIFHNDFTVHKLKEKTGRVKDKNGEWRNVTVKGYATPAKIVVLHMWLE